MERDYLCVPPFGGVHLLDASKRTDNAHKSQDHCAQMEAHPSKKTNPVSIEAFPERLRAIIGDNSVLSFAQKAKVSDSALHKWLNRRSMPTLDNLAAIAEAGDVSLGWLASGEGPMQSTALARVEPPGLPHARDHQVIYDADDRAVWRSGPPTVQVPVFDVPLEAGQINRHARAARVDLIVSYDRVFRDWLRNECRIDPDRAFYAPVKGQSMEKTLFDGDWILGETQDFVDREGIFALSLNGVLLVKHVQPGRARGTLDLISQNPRFPTYTASVDNGDELHIIGRYVRRVTR